MEIAIPTKEKTTKRAIGTWDDAYTKATAALAKLSASEKIGIVTGVGWQGGPCVGNTKAASSIGYPSLCLQGTLHENFDSDDRASTIWLNFYKKSLVLLWTKQSGRCDLDCLRGLSLL
jgi:hypothetical protein